MAVALEGPVDATDEDGRASAINMTIQGDAVRCMRRLLRDSSSHLGHARDDAVRWGAIVPNVRVAVKRDERYSCAA
jgi:hypothetical protein